AVLLEQLDHGLEFPALRVGRGVFYVLDVLEITVFQNVPKGVAIAMLSDPRIHGLSKLGIFLAKRNSELPARSEREIWMHVQLGEDRLPEVSEIVVDHRDGRQSRVHHLEHVVVFEDFWGGDDHNGWLAF